MSFSRTKSVDIFKGDTPPPNTPYWLILKYKGYKYMRGWIACDRYMDNEGHKIRFNQYVIRLEERGEDG